MKVVLAEDEAKTRNGLQKFLKGLDFVELAAICEDGQAALSYLKNAQADVLLTDIRMPGLSGLELIRALRERDANLKIIILSGYRDFSYAQEAIELGVHSYLTKPTNPAELRAVLEKIHREQLRQQEVLPEVGNLTVQKTLEYIAANYHKRITLAGISTALYVSPQYLCKLFKKHSGKNLSEYILEYRMEKAKIHLKEIQCNISQVAKRVGFHDTGYFSSSFKKLYGMTPVEYRNHVTAVTER